MATKQSITPARLQRLLNTARIGWWKADFTEKHYICSDYIIKMLGLDSEILTFEHFRLLIHPDYRERITKEFASIVTEEIYEQTFPLQTQFGELWLHSQLFEKEKDEEGHLIAWGYLQAVIDPQEIKAEKALEKFNTQVHQQNNISRSLSYFLQTEDTSEVIRKILQNLLEQFHASRTYIIEYNWENQTQNNTFEINAQGIPSQQSKLTHLPMSATPWWTQQMKNQIPILLSNLNDLPEEASLEKELLASQQIKSLMVIPMIAQDRVWGYMGIDMVDQYHNWSYEDYQWFASLGNISSICLELHKAKFTALKEREYFKNIYKYMPVGYVRLKLLRNISGEYFDYRFIDINPAFSTITGIKKEYIIGKTIREVQLSSDIDQQIQELEKILQSSSFTQTNFKSVSRDQYYRCITYSPVSDEVVTLFSDITETHKAYEALDRSEKELRNIYKNIPVGIEIYDKDGILRDMNKKDLEIFGLPNKNEALGVNLFENPNLTEEIKQQIREKKSVDFSIKYDFNNVKNYYYSQLKGVKDLLVRVSPLYNSKNELESYMLIIIDNTETYMAYNKIEEFENFFSMIANFAKVGYFKWDHCQRKGFALEQWYKNWGEPTDSDLNNVAGIYQMAHPDDRAKLVQLYQQLIQGKIKGTKEEVRISNGKGGWRWIRSTVICTKFDPKNQTIELIGVNFDITELKEIEAKLIEAKNKAETLDKLKSAFLANMSHEIRTPLNAIVGFSNLLAETSDPEEQKQYVSIIQENNDLLLQLISDVLDLSKIESGTFEINYGDVDVNLLCQEIVRSLSLKTTPGVKLEFEQFDPVCHIWGDRNRLMQILTNFINNAIKFTAQGYIHLGYQVSGQQIKFYVSDTGVGIPAQNLKSIFERFVKLNSFIHGTGLGLSICKSMVEQMGGQIGVESEEGKGSRFWFILPLITPDIDENTLSLSTPQIEMPNHLTKPHPTILVAEDTESNFILISTILKKNYTILWAQNGVEVLQQYRENRPDLILMDIRMPEMDGLEATRQIRREDKQIPIIALTAFAFDSDKSKTIEAGCNAYLSKPINALVLKQTITELLK